MPVLPSSSRLRIASTMPSYWSSAILPASSSEVAIARITSSFASASTFVRMALRLTKSTNFMLKVSFDQVLVWAAVG
jgi:hypothetical protein